MKESRLMFHRAPGMALRYVVALLGALAILAQCTQAQDVRAILDADLHPPALLSAELVDERTAEIRFNKPASALPESFSLELDVDVPGGGNPFGDPAVALETDESGSDEGLPDEGAPEAPGFSVSREHGETLTIELAEASKPGTRYTLAGAAEDENGNSLQFVVYLYGYNPDLPRLRINEFSTRRSANHPEIVELLVSEPGNLGGMMLTNGTAGDFNDRYIFPGINVSAGDYILVHFRPEGTPEEVNETGEDLAQSGGLNAHDEARDLWVDGASGLPGNNGVIVLYETPGGNAVDAAPYTNRESDSDERYDGFGSNRMKSWVNDIVDEGVWVIEGARPRPEDLIWIDDSTATRSVNRTPGAANTRSRSDWHTAPTGGSSWGEKNTTQEYMP